MEERVRCQPERRERRACRSKVNLEPFFTSSTNVKTIPTCQQSRHKTGDGQREWEGRSGVERERDEECCNGVKGMQERERERDGRTREQVM